MTNNGTIRVRTIRVRQTMDSAHEIPESGPNSGLQSEWNSTSSPEMAQYRGCIIAESIP